MNAVATAAFSAAFLFGGMLLLLEVGRRRGLRRLAQDPNGAREGLGTVDGAVFGLLGLLIAFTFSGAVTRLDTRRSLIVEEANAIGTVWLRLDLVDPAARPAFQDSLRKYVDARLEAYRNLKDEPAAALAMAHATALQSGIWTQAVKSAGTSPEAARLLVPAVNDMFDITTVRAAALRSHPPRVVYLMLAAAALISSLLAGHGMAGSRVRSWVHMACFAGVIAAAFYIILDIEFPRLGLIRIDDFDQILRDVRTGMN